MTSPRKVEANQLNALRSTGPRTPEGKAISSQNALKHGLLSREVLLPGEPEAELVALGRALRAQLRPVGMLETELVDGIAAAIWRRRRMLRVETGLLLFRGRADEARDAEEEARSYEGDGGLRDLALDLDSRDQERRAAALERARKARARAGGEVPSLGRAFAGSEGAFGSLARYEAGLERAFYRALHEVARLQALRAGKPIPVPADPVADLDLPVEPAPSEEPVSQQDQLQDPVSSGADAEQG